MHTHSRQTRTGLTEWKQSVCECDCLFVGVSPLGNPATPHAGQVPWLHVRNEILSIHDQTEMDGGGGHECGCCLLACLGKDSAKDNGDSRDLSLLKPLQNNNGVTHQIGNLFWHLGNI